MTRPNELSADVSVFCDIRCELGEGPTYDPSTDTVFWFDILGQRFLSRGLADTNTTITELPFMASAMGIIDDGRQLIVAEDGLYIRHVNDGRLELAHPMEAENTITRSNDSRVHTSGAFWVSTMGKNAENGAGAIYHFRAGRLTKLYDGISIPNSICFSPDGSVAYFCDTQRARIMHVSVEPETGLPTAEPTVFYDHGNETGGLDGSVCDADGRIWNATWGASSLNLLGADGTHQSNLTMPALQVSCPAFAGQGADHIIVTSALQGMDDDARQKDAQGGMTFLVKAVGVAGRHEPRVIL